MSQETKIRRLNDLLAAELGRVACGEGIYRWAWSEDLYYVSAVRDDVGDIVCSIVQAPGSAVVALVPDYEKRRFHGLDQQWVVAMWVDPGPERLWSAQFGSSMPYPRNGYLFPTNMCLGKGEVPDLTITEEVVRKVRAERQKKFHDYVQESEDAIAKQEKASADRILDEVGDACTAFGNVPGKKGGVSFPGVREDAALFRRLTGGGPDVGS